MKKNTNARRGRPVVPALEVALSLRQDGLARKIARTIATLRESHLPADEVRQVWAGERRRAAARLSRLPQELAAPIVAASADVGVVEQLLREAACRALSDLVGTEAPPVRRPRTPTLRPSSSFTRARTRSAELQAALLAVRGQIAAGELVPAERVEATWNGRVSAVRASLLAWPQTLSDQAARAAALSGATGVHALLAEAVKRVLLELDEGRRPPRVSNTRAVRP